MKTLRLNEGDPVRITGAHLPKGKRVKLQAQTTDFLEISDPKAVYVFNHLRVVYFITFSIVSNKHSVISHVSHKAISLRYPTTLSHSNY